MGKRRKGRAREERRGYHQVFSDTNRYERYVKRRERKKSRPSLGEALAINIQKYIKEYAVEHRLKPLEDVFISEKEARDLLNFYNNSDLAKELKRYKGEDKLNKSRFENPVVYTAIIDFFNRRKHLRLRVEPYEWRYYKTIAKKYSIEGQMRKYKND